MVGRRWKVGDGNGFGVRSLKFGTIGRILIVMLLIGMMVGLIVIVV